MFQTHVRQHTNEQGKKDYQNETYAKNNLPMGIPWKTKQKYTFYLFNNEVREYKASIFYCTLCIN